MIPAFAFVVHTKPNAENYAVDFLVRFGHQVYFPRVLEHLSRTGRVVDLIRPFLPRYLFVWDQGQDVSGIKNAPGVSNFVRQGVAFARVGIEVLSQIQAREGADGLVRLDGPALPSGGPYRSGEPLKYRLRGPLGYEDAVHALFDCENGEQRAFVFLNLFSGQVRSEVNVRDLERYPSDWKWV